MVPIWAAIVVTVIGLGGGFIIGLMVSSGPKSMAAAPEPLNEFDAYNDTQLKQIRAEKATIIRQRRKHGYNVDKYVYELTQMDKEFERRKNAVIAAEESEAERHRRELAMFDSVYGIVLRDIETKPTDK